MLILASALLLVTSTHGTAPSCHRLPAGATKFCGVPYSTVQTSLQNASDLGSRAARSYRVGYDAVQGQAAAKECRDAYKVGDADRMLSVNGWWLDVLVCNCVPWMCRNRIEAPLPRGLHFCAVVWVPYPAQRMRNAVHKHWYVVTVRPTAQTQSIDTFFQHRLMHFWNGQTHLHALGIPSTL